MTDWGLMMFSAYVALTLCSIGLLIALAGFIEPAFVVTLIGLGAPVIAYPMAQTEKDSEGTA